MSTERKRMGPPHIHTEEQQQKIIEMYRQGETLIAIAAKFACSDSTVRNCLVRHNEPLRAKGWHAVRELTEQEVAAIIRKYKSGESQMAIAADLSTSQHKVSAVLRTHGFYHGKEYLLGKKHPFRRGGMQHKNGYLAVLIRSDDPHFEMRQRNALLADMGCGYVLEHRLVMARHLGRSLRSGESVHHINGIKDDNRIKNLQLRQGNHGTGSVLVCGECGSNNLIHKAIAEVI